MMVSLFTRNRVRNERMRRGLFLGAGLGILLLLATTDASDDARELRFSGSPKMRQGDAWSYLVSSSDGSLDGKILRIILEKQEARKRSFSVRLNGGDPRTVSLDQHIGWFMPVEAEREVIVLQAVPYVFDHVERGLRSEKNEVTYTYDANGARYAHGYYVHAVGPVSTVVPGGEYSCAQITQQSASAVRAADKDASASKLLSETWLSPQLPAAIRARSRRPGTTAMLLFELQSSKTSAPSLPSARPRAIVSTERQRAVDWVRTNSRWGDQCQAVDDFIFQLHAGTQDHPGATLTWLLGSGTTKNGKAYLLEWGLGVGCGSWWRWWCGGEQRFAATELTGQPTDPIADEDAIAFYAGGDFTLRELRRVAGADGLMPPFRNELGGGFNGVNVRKPKAMESSVTVGLRTSGDKGVNWEIKPESLAVSKESLPDGSYEIYFVFSDNPETLYQGDPITLAGKDVEIQIAKLADGCYGVRRLQ